MTPLAPISLVIGMLLMLGLLLWVGWRFFLAPPAPVEPRPRAASAPWPRFRMPQFRMPRLQLPKRLPPGTARWILLPLLLTGAAIAFVLQFSRSVVLAPVEGTTLAHEGRVRTELNPERLVPPPPLPPSFFIIPERADLRTADRDWAKLDPAFTQITLHLFERMKQQGYTLVLLEGYRSPERQDLLASQGTHVTHARAGQSRHQFGMAADIAFSRDGRLVISERDPWAAAGYEALGRTAEELGLVWGGRWAMRDLGHVESRASRRASIKTYQATEDTE